MRERILSEKGAFLGVWIRFGMPRLFRFLFVFLHSLHHIPFVDNPCWQLGYCGDLFSDLPFSHVSNMAQNSNLGSTWAYSFFRPVLVTGLIEALLTQYFQILAIRAGNPKLPLLRGRKPALLFPIGWQIVVQTGWSRGKGKRRAVLGIGFFR